MADELIRAACEAANCKYPDMEAMANFKREVTPSAVIGLLDGLRHAKGIAAINDARASGAAETIQHLRAENAALRAQLPNQGGEAVAELSSDEILMAFEENGFRIEPGASFSAKGQIAQLLNAVGAILSAHPADQVADDLTMVKVSRELPAWLGDKHSLGEKLYSIGWRGIADAQYCGAERLLEELRTLLGKP